MGSRANECRSHVPSYQIRPLFCPYSAPIRWAFASFFFSPLLLLFLLQSAEHDLSGASEKIPKTNSDKCRRAGYFSSDCRREARLKQHQSRCVLCADLRGCRELWTRKEERGGVGYDKQGVDGMSPISGQGTIYRQLMHCYVV